MENKTIAERLHEAYRLLNAKEEELYDIVVANEADISLSDLHCTYDDYDNSIEIFLEGTGIEYPWEPSQKTRETIYAWGFDIVYWNFPDRDEIRGWEPRRNKDLPHSPVDQGYVDDRFVEAKWAPKYARK